MQAYLIVTTDQRISSTLVQSYEFVHSAEKCPVAVTTVFTQKKVCTLHQFHFSDPEGKIKASRDPFAVSQPVHEVLTEICQWQTDHNFSICKNMQLP